ncbi:Rho-GAP domain-containing protein [Mycena chlorophos]|uniref:Rho-GAP domain-containing protein n=1 Tax=Mycena chlorophos TaxID=658473 RepID=A0A8H6W071_MYCCL|nr:Rho-GAP domain-containing protein [Mycena chlorophos]
MGQAESALPTSASSQKSFYIAASTGSKLKRAFARRKKSEDPVDSQQRPRHLPFTRKASKDAPPPPAKPVALQVPKKVPLPPLPPVPPQQVIVPASRASVMPVTPGVSPAVNWMISQEKAKAQPAAEPAEAESDNSNPKEAWRKSDATITRTGTRTSRPVSMADSTHTITAVAKRLSALVNDAELPEEDEDRKETPSAMRTKPRSMSLNTGAPQAPSMASPKLSSETAPPLTPSTRETPTLTRAAANGIIAPSSSGLQSTGNNIRGRLAAWSATTNSTPSPGSRPHPSPDSTAPSRQPAVSLTASLAPAAGLAKRAVEKMGRWGFGGGSSNNSSSSSSTAPSSYTGPDYSLARTESNQSGGGGKPQKHRRTPNSVSAAWSAHSSSVSDLDAFAPPPEPHLGTCLRGPLRVSPTGAGLGGVVFGVKLRIVVSETAITGGRRPDVEDASQPMSVRLEQRLLPALVVRCAQHLLIWGVQEEGLFRYLFIASPTGNVDDLAGADYDMTECAPGDLDPHSVASVFKAFLRERLCSSLFVGRHLMFDLVPEPILTQGLAPYFEAALVQETTLEQELNPRPKVPAGPSLPSGPRNGQMMRKPPSLSTLAQPNFTSLRAPSASLINALRNLINQLPRENRDLLRTVTDLIRATAKQSKETKMPLSNLLLVFCPSLNMNPPLLRVLCEAESVWEEPPIVDIKRQSYGVLDIRASEKDDSPSTRPRSPGARSRRANPAAVYLEHDHVDEASLAQILTDRVQANSPSDVSSEDTSFASRQDTASPLLSSSAESLATPPSSLSLDHAPLEKQLDPEVVVSDEPSIHSPIQFPSLANNSPDTPISSTRPIPTLSLPSLTSSPKSDSNSPGSAPPSPFRRLKKPSLHLLFSKRSASPLISSSSTGHPNISGPYLQPAKAASDSSLSTPVTAVTAPQGSPLNLPPVLDTPIESPSLRDGLGLAPHSPEADDAAEESPEDDEDSAPLPVLGQTPIADFYQTPASSSSAVNHLRPHPTRKISKASISSTTSNRLGILEGDGDGEDWTKTVLLAADVDWRMHGP